MLNKWDVMRKEGTESKGRRRKEKRVRKVEKKELKDTLKDAVHDSKLKSPRRKKEEHA